VCVCVCARVCVFYDGGFNIAVHGIRLNF